MIRAITLFLSAAVAVASGATRGQAAPRAADSLRVAGKEYVRLSDWAKANDLEARWLKQEETLQLTNRRAKVLLTVDSREAEINGVAVWLLFPTVSRQGGLYLAQLDAQTTLQPILSPPRNRPGASVKSVCLDAGHGGKDPGYRVGANQEKKYTLLLTQELRDQLTRAGMKVSLTRNSDAFVELPARPDLAKRRGADLFVSLHFNASETSQNTVQGAEVYCLTPAGAPSTNKQGEGGGARSFPGNRFNDKNMFLAYQIQRSLTKGLGVEDRGVHRARFAVLRDAVMPAVLIEGGFMSHPTEGRKIFDPDYRREMARAIANGLLAYKRAVEQGS